MRASALLTTSWLLAHTALSRSLSHTSSASQSMAAARSTRNVLGSALVPCGTQPLTGFYRDGCCETGPDDRGVHVVCARVTADFLAFTAARGNDLSTPRPWGFPGLQPGDHWCLCADRWREAYDNGVAPPVYLLRTHENALRYVTLQQLREHALDVDTCEDTSTRNDTVTHG